jgi:hypothetical protein
MEITPEDMECAKIANEWFNDHVGYFNLDKVYGIDIISELYALVKQVKASGVDNING